MKTILSIIAILALITISNAQKLEVSNVPSTVTSNFNSKFPKAESITWEMDFENYNAEFKSSKNEMLAKFDKNGKWLETETAIKVSSIPKSVKESLTKEFGDVNELTITDCLKVENPENIFSYSMEVNKGELQVDIVVSEKGDFISKEEVKEKE